MFSAIGAVATRRPWMVIAVWVVAALAPVARMSLVSSTMRWNTPVALRRSCSMKTRASARLRRETMK